mmetsp:Transcript_24974/g.58605  ORF Transcript_24974/g.58605 Transcript_24974/m.58605 type:complete len:384 (+) Transcript_24974:195-1346(+)
MHLWANQSHLSGRTSGTRRRTRGSDRARAVKVGLKLLEGRGRGQPLVPLWMLPDAIVLGPNHILVASLALLGRVALGGVVAFVLVEAPHIEVTLRVGNLGGGRSIRILFSEKLLRQHQPPLVRQLIPLRVPPGPTLAAVGPAHVLLPPRFQKRRVVPDVRELIDGDLTGILVGPRAVALSGGRLIAVAAGLSLATLVVPLRVVSGGTGPWKAVPNRIGVVDLVVRKREMSQDVAAHEVAVLVIVFGAVSRARALTAVESIAHSKTHAFVVQRCRGPVLNLESNDPGDFELPWCEDDDLVVQVPHDTSCTGSVDVLHGVAVRTHGTIHVEGQERSFAWTIEREDVRVVKARGLRLHPQGAVVLGGRRCDLRHRGRAHHTGVVRQ